MLIALIAGMGLAFAMVLSVVLGEKTRTGIAAMVGTAWYVLIFLPLGLAFFAPEVAPWAIDGSLDYGGAAPLHLALGTTIATLAIVFRRTAAVPVVAWATLGVKKYAVGLGLLVVGWGTWLMSTEQDINRYSWIILTNTAVMAVGAAVGSLILQLVRLRGMSGRTTCAAVVTGLAGATACSAHINPTAAIVLGTLMGALTTQVFEVRRIRAGSGLAPVVGIASILGAVVGLTALGLLDLNQGFFFTGQPTLPLAQAALIGITVALSATMSILIGVVARSLQPRR
jgi:ammonia channel protein AmtB